MWNRLSGRRPGERGLLRWTRQGIFAAFVVFLLVRSGSAAYETGGMVVPDLFVDPFNSYSAVPLPGRTAPALRFPDQLVAVNGAALAPLSATQPHPASLTHARLTAMARSGARAVTLDFTRGEKRIRITRNLTRIGPREVVWFWGIYALVGVLIAWSGIVVITLSERVSAARAYALWSVATFAFLATFFDYHTSMRLVPFFSAATVWAGTGFVWLALAFPEPPRGWASRVRALSVVTGLAATALSVALIAGPRVGADVLAARLAASFFAPLASLMMLASLLLRLRGSDGNTRRQLSISLVGMALTLLVVSLGFGVAALRGDTTVHALIPLVMPLIPLSIGWALVRHNILGTRAVLTRRLLLFPLALLALGAAIIAWLGLRREVASGMTRLVPVLLSCGGFVVVATSLQRLVSRVLFPASAEFRPTIEQLAEALTDLSRREEVHDAIEHTVSRWLPSGRVQLRPPAALDEIDHLPANAREDLGVGRLVWTDVSPWDRHLLVPMRSLGVLRGVIDVAPKKDGALFTEEDLALLDTIASLGAVALHNAEIIDALEKTSRFEIVATREDKRLTLGLLGAELSHEIAHPLQFFRGILRRGAKAPLDPDDVEIGEEEIGRMERMLASLRRLEAPPPRSVPVALAEPVARALVLVRESLSERGIRPGVDLPAGCVVLADVDGLVQVFANLLRNAARAALAEGSIGVHARLETDGSLVIDVWDDGPGVPEHLVDTLFHRWVTSRSHEGGSGLGLSVAQNLVNSFSWHIEYLRGAARTTFRLTVPPEMVVATGPVATLDRGARAR